VFESRVETPPDGVKRRKLAAMWEALGEWLGLGSWAMLERLGPRGRQVATVLMVSICLLATLGSIIALVVLLT
jgi:hypothetical protein